MPTIVLAFDGDAVDRAVKAHPEGLKADRSLHRPGAALGNDLRLRYSSVVQPQQRPLRR